MVENFDYNDFFSLNSDDIFDMENFEIPEDVMVTDAEAADFGNIQDLEAFGSVLDDQLDRTVDMDDLMEADCYDGETHSTQKQLLGSRGDTDELEYEHQMEELQKEYEDARRDLEKAQKELAELLEDKEDGWIGVDPAIGWNEARIDDAQQRMNDIEREMERLK